MMGTINYMASEQFDNAHGVKIKCGGKCRVLNLRFNSIFGRNDNEFLRAIDAAPPDGRQYVNATDETE